MAGFTRRFISCHVMAGFTRRFISCHVMAGFYPEVYQLPPRIKISVNTDISVIGFYGNIRNIGNIGKISMDIFTQISVIKIFHILII